MIHPILQKEILIQLHRLSPDLQRRVLDFAQALVMSPPKGIPGNGLLRFAGTVTPEDARAMTEAIEAGCEQVNESEGLLLITSVRSRSAI